jgi:hypothetical protein
MMTETRNIAPHVWTRLPNGIEIMQTDVAAEVAVCTMAEDGSVVLSAGTNWRIRTQ